MKKFTLLVIIGFMLTGCAGVQFTPQSKEELVWTSANIAGFHAIQKHNEYAVKAEVIAKKIETLEDTAMVGDTLNPLLLELSLYLSQEKDIDPVLVHSLTLLLPMIHVKPGAVPDDKMELIRAAANGYLAGVNSGRAFESRLSDPNEKIAYTPELE
jgi:hypothetical protein